jgi:ribosome-binding protein aMBF1 (putative translation factor)
MKEGTMNWNEQIKQNRNRLGLSQLDLADELNVTQPCVSSWEAGKQTPDMRNLVKLETLFELAQGTLLVPIAYLSTDQRNSR